MENIFQLSLDEIDKKMDEILSKTTPEKLIEELKECGYKLKKLKHKYDKYEKK